MPSLVRGTPGTTSDLNWFVTVNGALTDAYEVGYRILSLVDGLPGVQVFPAVAGEYQDVSSAPGRFAPGSYYAYDPAEGAGWTPDLEAALGPYQIEWRWKLLDTYIYQTGQEDFVVLEEDTSVPAIPTDGSVLLVVQDELGSPVENVRIRIYSSADIFVADALTDENGRAGLLIPGLPDPGIDYIVRLFKDGVSFPAGSTQRITVLDPLPEGGTNIFDFVAVLLTSPASLDPDMCRLYGYFTDPSLRPLKQLTLLFHPREGYPSKVIAGAPFSGWPTVIRNRIIASSRSVRTDKNGYVEFDLPRASVFDVYLQGLDAPDHSLLAAVWIPDLSGISIHEVLFPYMKKVIFASDSLAVAVGETLEVDVTLVTSNYQPVSGQPSLETLLTFAASDPEKVLVKVSPTGTLLITGLSPGQSQLLTERVAGTYAPRRPEVEDLVIEPSVPLITVT